MPRRARPGHRLRMEAELSDAERAALAEQCDLFGVPRDAWNRIPSFGNFQTSAALRLAGRLRTEEGMTTEAAINTAAARLDLEPATIHTRAARLLAEAFPAAA